MSDETENKPKPRGFIISGEEGKSFSLRSEMPDTPMAPQTREWKSIALDFLCQQDDVDPFGPTAAFNSIRTRRADEFVAGQGSAKWPELRRKAKLEAKELKRRSKK